LSDDREEGTDEKPESAERPAAVRGGGLKAISDARAERRLGQPSTGMPVQGLPGALGRSFIANRMSPTTWLVVGGILLTTIVVAWLVSGSTLSRAKADLHGKQRAAVATVGNEWFPLRDRIERLTLETAGDFKADFVAPDVAQWDFRSMPGIYLRMRQADAKDVPALRKRAQESARDAFTGCLMRQNNPTIAALAKGEGDAGGLAVLDQPWNLRQAYGATRILDEDWVAEMNKQEDQVHLKVFEVQHEKAVKEEIPLAIDIIKRAQFFLLVLDEDVPEAKELATHGKITEDVLQQVPHPARIRIVNLKTNQDVARLRLQGEADAIVVQGAVNDPGARAAMKRQVMNCALANNVWAALTPAK
jgi:hypothetical protein